MVRVLFPSLTSQAAGSERLLEDVVGMGFLVLGVPASVTEAVDMCPCQQISGQSQKLCIIRPKYNFDTHHLLILLTTGYIFSC